MKNILSHPEAELWSLEAGRALLPSLLHLANWNNFKRDIASANPPRPPPKSLLYVILETRRTSCTRSNLNDCL